MSIATQYLYLTTSGWKSGQPHQIEIWFVDYLGRYYIVSEQWERAHWVINITHEPRVTVRIGSREAEAIPAQARPIDADQEPDLAAQVNKLMDAKYRWSHGLIVELWPDK